MSTAYTYTLGDLKRDAERLGYVLVRRECMINVGSESHHSKMAFVQAADDKGLRAHIAYGLARHIADRLVADDLLLIEETSLDDAKDEFLGRVRFRAMLTILDPNAPRAPRMTVGTGLRDSCATSSNPVSSTPN